MKFILFFSIIFLCESVFSQPSDFILLKKKNKTVATYFAGTNIGFVTNTGAFIQANILKIKNDSLFLKEYVIRQIPTQLGIYVLDTVSSYLYQYHYNDIKAIGKTGRRFDVSGSGAGLMGGGVLLFIASGISFSVDSKRFSPELMGAAVALTGVGYLLNRFGNKGIIIGKKYSLVYVQAISAK